MRVRVAKHAREKASGQLVVLVKGEISRGERKRVLEESLRATEACPSYFASHSLGPGAWQVEADFKDHDDEALEFLESLIEQLRALPASGSASVSVQATSDAALFDALLQLGSGGCRKTVVYPSLTSRQLRTGGPRVVSGALARCAAEWFASLDSEIRVGSGLSKSFVLISPAEFVDWFAAEAEVETPGVSSAVCRIDDRPVVLENTFGSCLEVLLLWGASSEPPGPVDEFNLLSGAETHIHSATSIRYDSFEDSLAYYHNRNKLGMLNYTFNPEATILDVGEVFLVPEDLEEDVANKLRHLINQGLVVQDGRVFEVLVTSAEDQEPSATVEDVRDLMLPLLGRPPS